MMPLSPRDVCADAPSTPDQSGGTPPLFMTPTADLPANMRSGPAKGDEAKGGVAWRCKGQHYDLFS